jgi:hypothetical protein
MHETLSDYSDMECEDVAYKLLATSEEDERESSSASEASDDEDNDDLLSSIADELGGSEKCGPEFGAKLAWIVYERFLEPTALDIINPNYGI